MKNLQDQCKNKPNWAREGEFLVSGCFDNNNAGTGQISPNSGRGEIVDLGGYPLSLDGRSKVLKVNTKLAAPPGPWAMALPPQLIAGSKNHKRSLVVAPGAGSGQVKWYSSLNSVLYLFLTFSLQRIEGRFSISG